MEQKIDLTFYNQIKSAFPAVKDVVLIINLTSEKVEELTAQSFDCIGQEYSDALEDLLRNDKPYVVIDGIYEEPTFFCLTKDFYREENLVSGKITRFKLDPMKKTELDIEQVKKELALLSQLLFGNSKAS